MSKHSLEDFQAFQLDTSAYHRLVDSAITLARVTGARKATARRDNGLINIEYPGKPADLRDELWATVERIYQKVDAVMTGTSFWRVTEYGGWSFKVHDHIVVAA